MTKLQPATIPEDQILRSLPDIMEMWKRDA